MTDLSRLILASTAALALVGAVLLSPVPAQAQVVRARTIGSSEPATSEQQPSWLASEVYSRAHIEGIRRLERMP